MNLYQCWIEYIYAPITSDEIPTRQQASELIVAEHPDEAQVLFYGLHLQALIQRQIPPDKVQVEHLKGYVIEGEKGRYHGAPPATSSAL